MRTVTFLSALNRVAIKTLGTADNLPTQQAVAFTDSIQEHLGECWERYFWPEWTLTEQRYYRQTWTATSYGTTGTEVYHSGTDAYYSNNAAAISTDVPGVSAKWDLLTGADLRMYISLDQTGQTAIGTVKSLHTHDPRQYPGAPRIEWSAGPDGIEIDSFTGAGTSVWVVFRKRPSLFTTTAWAAGNYAAGSLVYYGTTGECYVNSSSATSGDVPGTAAKWVKQDFPYVLRNAVPLFCAHDHLAESGQLESKRDYRADAEAALEDEWHKAANQQGQVPRFRVLTRAAA